MIDPANYRLAPALSGLVTHLCANVKGLAGQQGVVRDALRGMKAMGIRIEGNFASGGRRKATPVNRQPPPAPTPPPPPDPTVVEKAKAAVAKAVKKVTKRATKKKARKKKARKKR